MVTNNNLADVLLCCTFLSLVFFCCCWCRRCICHKHIFFYYDFIYKIVRYWAESSKSVGCSGIICQWLICIFVISFNDRFKIFTFLPIFVAVGAHFGKAMRCCTATTLLCADFFSISPFVFFSFRRNRIMLHDL